MIRALAVGDVETETAGRALCSSLDPHGFGPQASDYSDWMEAISSTERDAAREHLA